MALPPSCRGLLTRLRGSIGHHALVLGGFAMVAALLLAGGDRLTRDTIAQRKAEDLAAILAEVVPPDLHDQSLAAHTLATTGPQGQPVTVYQAVDQGQVTAVAFGTRSPGYGGPIEMLMGVAADGTLLGVRVLSHSETPGLGDGIEVRKDDWILQFAGLSLSNPPVEKWTVKKDGGAFDQFAGATITPRNVVTAVREGLQWFRRNRATLLTRHGASEETRS